MTDKIKDYSKLLKGLKYKIVGLERILGIEICELRGITPEEVNMCKRNRGKLNMKREEFETLKKTYNVYRELTINEITDIIETKPIEETITYLKDELGWRWEDISKVTDVSVSHCKRLRNNYLDKCGKIEKRGR